MIRGEDASLDDAGPHGSMEGAQSQGKQDTLSSDQGPGSEPGPGPGPSIVSLKSDASVHRLIDFKDERHKEDQINLGGSETPGGQCGDPQTNLGSVFQMLNKEIKVFVDGQLEVIKNHLHSGSRCSEIPEDDSEREQAWEALLVIIKHILRSLGQDQDQHHFSWLSSQIDRLARVKDSPGSPLGACQQRLRSSLKEKFQRLSEGTAGSACCLDEVYTELLITEGRPGAVNQEHEVRQVEAASWRAGRPRSTIRHEDVFKAPPGRSLPVRKVMTKGVAGIGKTVLTQKFALDWAEGRANQDVDLAFPFTFRELNLLRASRCSLLGLLRRLFPSADLAGACRLEDLRVVFIFDGMDECRLPLDFSGNAAVTDAAEPSSVDALLTNLIAGNLLPSANVWITTRPGAASQIPPGCIDMVTEIQGFTNPQKEEYFRKRFQDQEEAGRIVYHVRAMRSLHIMCHIPVFCWITATVLEHLLRSSEGEELPRTLTEMYVYFLLVQSKVRSVKFAGGAAADPLWNPDSVGLTEALGRLAYEQLQRGNLIFYESDLNECGIDARAAAIYSGVFTQIFKEVSGLFHQKVFCFVHLSVQEFLAALYVHVRFFGSGENLLSEGRAGPGEAVGFYQGAVDRALRSPHGTLDLFLRFLLGLSLPTNQALLHGFLRQPSQEDEAEVRQAVVDYIKEKIDEAPSAEKSLNLFHCLNELNDRSLVEQIQRAMSSGKLSTGDLSPAQWSALVFILLSSEKDLDVFDLKRFSASEEALLKLLPVVKASKQALLDHCSLSERSCAALASVLGSSPDLKELDLSNNDLGDSGLQLLCAGLRSPGCPLEALRLSGCLIKDAGCAALASALSGGRSRLRRLDLSYNPLGGSGAELLSAKMEALRLRAEPVGVQWLTPGLRKYHHEPTFDPNTMSGKLRLSEDGRTARFSEGERAYPAHPDRFDWWPQVLCSAGLTGRAYWEVACEGRAFVAVAYRGVRRKGDDGCCEFGENDQSWRLNCYGGRYSVTHNSTTTSVPSPSSPPSPPSPHRVAVYVDWPAGVLSFYSVGADSLTHLKTFNTTFTEALYPGFGFWFWPGSWVSLCPQ